MTLKGVRPLVWRRIQGLGDFTLRRLHRVLPIAMGWEDCHLHKFVADRQSYGPLGFLPELASPSSSNENRSVASGSRVRLARWCSTNTTSATGGSTSCPPEDRGGPPEYEELLEALADESDPRHEELTEWVGPGFRSEVFSLEAVNKELAGLRKRMVRRRTARSSGKSRVQ